MTAHGNNQNHKINWRQWRNRLFGTRRRAIITVLGLVFVVVSGIVPVLITAIFDRIIFPLFYALLVIAVLVWIIRFALTGKRKPH